MVLHPNSLKLPSSLKTVTVPWCPSTMSVAVSVSLGENPWLPEISEYSLISTITWLTWFPLGFNVLTIWSRILAPSSVTCFLLNIIIKTLNYQGYSRNRWASRLSWHETCSKQNVKNRRLQSLNLMSISVKTDVLIILYVCRTWYGVRGQKLACSRLNLRKWTRLGM